MVHLPLLSQATHRELNQKQSSQDTKSELIQAVSIPGDSFTHYAAMPGLCTTLTAELLGEVMCSRRLPLECLRDGCLMQQFSLHPACSNPV